VTCPVCNDTDYICENCEQPDGECECIGGPELIACPEVDAHDEGDDDAD
jgi:hypothetical protein